MTEQEYVLLRTAIGDLEALARGSYGRLKGKQRQVLTEVVEDLRRLQGLLQNPHGPIPASLETALAECERKLGRL